MYYLWVTVTLTSDLVCRIGIESGTYFLYSLRCECIFRFGSVTNRFLVTVALTSHLVFRMIMYLAYLLYYLR